MPGHFDAVILAGGECKRLHPLTSGTIKALLPVANKPLLSYPLKAVADAGIKHAFVVVSGERAASVVSAWLSAEYYPTTDMRCEVVVAPEEAGSAEALRLLERRLTSETVVVLSGDLLTDIDLRSTVFDHQLASGLATMVVLTRKTSPCSETKPGKPPKGVDYIGLDETGQRLLTYASSPDTIREIVTPMNLFRKFGRVRITTRLQDCHLYILSRAAITMLHDAPHLSSLRSDLMPHLVERQLEADLRGFGAAEEDVREGEDGKEEKVPLPGMQYIAEARRGTRAEMGGGVRVSVVPAGKTCTRITGAQSYIDVNREVADVNGALHLTGLKATKFDNIIGQGCTLGNKATIGPGCIVGDGCVIGDKDSVKKSLLGNNCKLGLNVKIVNSVLMDNVVIGDGCSIQNTVVCSGANIKSGCELKDCQVGPGYVVVENKDYKGEVLTKTK